jgi:hypothetical protein
MPYTGLPIYRRKRQACVSVEWRGKLLHTKTQRTCSTTKISVLPVDLRGEGDGEGQTGEPSGYTAESVGLSGMLEGERVSTHLLYKKKD